MADIDRLDIIISAEASKAEKQLNKLMAALGRLSGVLGGIDASGIVGLAESVQKLSSAMQGMNSVRTADFTRLAKNIQKLAGIDTQSLNAAASSMDIIGKALSGLGSASANAQQIGEMAKNLSKLGNKGIQNAIANMPQLAAALKNMMQVLQSAPRVSSNLIRMTEAMGKLASNGNRVESAARSLNSGFKSYGSHADTATRKTRSLASAIGLLYAKFWVLQRALKGLFGAIEKSMDFTETVNYFEVAMRKIGDDASRKWQENGYDSAEAYSESFSKRLKELTAKMTGFQIDSDGNAVLTNQKNLGLDPDKVLQYQAQYAQMADSIGMTEEAALNTSKALTMLGTDWASLRNISFDQAWEKFASALAGQSRAVRSLGIDITQATLQEYAYKYGLETAVSEMNQATKAQLRLLAILDQSKVAFGDLANTMQSPANQLRMLQQNFSNLARIIGNLFLPVIAKVLPYINGVVIALQRLFQWIGNLLGVKLSSINTSMGGMSDSIGGLIDDTEGETSALNDANKAAKKLRNTILGFDELNVLNDPDSSSKDSNTPSIGGSPLLDDAIEQALADYEKAWNDAFDRMENKAADFADKLTDSFKKLWKVAEPTRKAIKKLWDEGLSKLGKFTWTALKDFYDDFLVPVGRWTLGKGLPNLVNYTNDFLNKINWKRINASLKQFWKALAPFATSVGDGLIEFYKDLTSIGADFINKVVPGGIDALANALEKISPETAERIGYSLGIAATGILAFKTLAPVVGTLTSIADAIKKWDKLKETFAWLGGVKYLGIAAGLAGVVVALDKFGIIDVDWDWLWEKVKQIKDILSEFIGNVDVSGLSESIGNLWNAFQPFAKGFADALLDAFDFLLNRIGTPLLNGLIDIFNGLSAALGSIDPDLLEKIGYGIGVIAGSIAAIKISTKLLDDINSLYVGLKNLKDVYMGSNGASGALSSLGGNSSTGNASGSGWLSKLGESGLWTAGVFGTLKQTLNQFQKESDSQNYSALLTSLDELQECGEITDQQFNDFYKTLTSAQRKTVPFSDALVYIEDELKNAGISTEDFESVLSQTLGTLGVSAPEKAKIIGLGIGDGTKQGIEDSKRKVKEASEGLASQILDRIINTTSGIPEKIQKSLGNLWNIGKNAIQSFANGFSSIRIPMPHIDWNWNKVNFGSSSFSIPSFNLKWYAFGGFPNTGELFVANENGPEMIGKMGSRNVVANNKQITEGIKNAVVEGMMEVAMATSSGNSDDKPYILHAVLKTEDNEVLARAVEKGNFSRDWRYNPSPVY